MEYLVARSIRRMVPPYFNQLIGPVSRLLTQLSPDSFQRRFAPFYFAGGDFPSAGIGLESIVVDQQNLTIVPNRNDPGGLVDLVDIMAIAGNRPVRKTEVDEVHASPVAVID